jgi:hypothetical protein
MSGRFSGPRLAFSAAAPATFEASAESGLPEQERDQEPEQMSDSEIRRLEDRIDAVNREGQLRLDAAMARIDGSVARIGDQVAAVRQDISEQKAASKAHFQWLIAVIVGAALTLLIGLGGLVIGLEQVWTAGVQSGQTLHAPVKPP